MSRTIRVASELSTQLPLPFDDQPAGDRAPRSLTPETATLVMEIVRFGMVADEWALAELRHLYDESVAPLPALARMQLLSAVCETIQLRHARNRPADTSGATNVLLPFLFEDDDRHIVATAALELAAQMPLRRADPLTGPRLLKETASMVNGWRRGALLKGLVALGDESSLQLAGGCWRELSAEGRAVLAASAVVVPTEAMVAFYLDWLADAVEDPREADLGSVAGFLAGLPDHAPSPGVVRLERRFPGWAFPPGEAVDWTAAWTFAECADRFAPAFDALAAREQAPKVIPEILRRWRQHRVH